MLIIDAIKAGWKIYVSTLILGVVLTSALLAVLGEDQVIHRYWRSQRLLLSNDCHVTVQQTATSIVLIIHSASLPVVITNSQTAD